MYMPNFSLKGRVAIVSGARRGIGKAIALTFAAAGADVAICDKVVDGGELDSVAEEIQGLGRHSLALQTDISRKADVDNMVQKVLSEFGVVDILVNNAGIMVRRLLIESTEDDWNSIMDTNLKGYFLCSQVVCQGMIKRKTGNIVNIASISGAKAQKGSSFYSISKAGVIMLTKTLAAELIEHNIRVNAIGPGMTKTGINESIWRTPENFRKHIELLSWGKIPIGRLAEPAEQAATVLFLASDASSYITGSTIFVEGGWLS